MANKVKFGLSNVHFAPITIGEGGTITYGTPVALPGAVNLTLDPEGDSADFYADNTKYFNAFTNQGYSGSLEIALINDAFRTQILGESADTNGAMFENKDDTVKDFALGFQIDGDQSNRKYWFYNVSASRASTSSQTIEASKEPVTDTLNITAAARLSDGLVKVYMEPNASNQAAYDGFFSAVYERAV